MIKWHVISGPDTSHLCDVKIFDRFTDANKYADSLPLTPLGYNRPFKIKKFNYIKSEIFGDQVKITIKKEKV